MTIALGLSIALLIGLLLGRLRRRRREPVAELGGFLAGAVPVALTHERSERAIDLEEGALDPDELEDEPAWWDEGSDDEIG